jgi:hypothetical protein
LVANAVAFPGWLKLTASAADDAATPPRITKPSEVSEFFYNMVKSDL